jgi:Acetyltransferase (GNAT) domain
MSVSTTISTGARRFESHAYPCPAVFAEIEQLAPWPPFNTLAYARSRAAVGEHPYVFIERADGKVTAACVGFLQRGRFSRRLEIPSYAGPAAGAQFAEGIKEFCRAQGVWDLDVCTFGSEPTAIPQLGQQLERRPRWEFVLDITQELRPKTFSTNHRRNVERARKAGVQVVPCAEPSAAMTHLQAMNSSTLRRQQRGEDVSLSQGASKIEALLSAGAAEIFQARGGDGTVLSSILVLTSSRVAYYHSAGTTAEGMKLGASPFLITEVAERLRARGIVEFNLGGAEPENAGLYRFKTGFNAAVRTLEAAVFSGVGKLQRKLRSLLQMALTNPRAIPAAIGGVDSYVVYRTDPRTVSMAPLPADIAVGKLSDEELRSVADDADLGFSARKLDVLRNTAYGVRVGGELAHIGWLIDPEQDRAQSVRNARLRDGEREITHCVTSAKFRGRGLYPLAISHLCSEAARQGARSVIMMTSRDNVASQRGIEKAGLQPSGRIVRLFLRTSPKVGVTWRGHRWRP